jgi:ElaB/YqjD/DUF883 family membrane-anchored ribosome-binding protein
MTCRTLLTVVLLFTLGCQATRTAYYDTWEKFGYAKRERLVDNVKKARDEQTEAKKQFATALDEFKSITQFKGGQLDAAYTKLKSQYDTCQSQANQVNYKIQAVKNVAMSLFAEWQGEVAQISDVSLKNQSQQLLDKTQSNYAQLVTRMDAAAATMQPVLTKFNDRVLFLKSNLNAQAIASLENTNAELGAGIDQLIADMEKSIQEADAFISEMNAGK